MCYLDMIVGPSPILVGGTIILVAIGVLLLCGIVLVALGFMKAANKKDKEKDDKE